MTPHPNGADAVGSRLSANTRSAFMSVADEIRARLQHDRRIHNAAEVAVSEHGGTVTLRGTVRSLHQRLIAAEIAKSVRDVRIVDNELRIDPRDHGDEAEVRGVALQALMSHPDVPADRVDVGVGSGWLTLKGRVRHQSESDAAFDAVSRVPGVGGVTNKIQVISAGLDGWDMMDGALGPVAVSSRWPVRRHGAATRP
jgi:osmotically-inducible protein OsmY